MAFYKISVEHMRPIPQAREGIGDTALVLEVGMTRRILPLSLRPPQEAAFSNILLTARDINKRRGIQGNELLLHADPANNEPEISIDVENKRFILIWESQEPIEIEMQEQVYAIGQRAEDGNFVTSFAIVELES